MGFVSLTSIFTHTETACFRPGPLLLNNKRSRARFAVSAFNFPITLSCRKLVGTAKRSPSDESFSSNVMHGSSVVSALASDAKCPEFEHGEWC